MCGDVGTAPIEWQLPPAATKRGNTAVAVLQIEEPLHTGLRCATDALVLAAKVLQRDKSPRCIIGIRHPSRQIRPRPSARRRSRVRKDCFVLLIEQPLTNRIA